MFQKQVNLIYEQTFNKHKYEVIQINPSFQNLLKNQSQIIIQTSLNSKIQFYSQTQTFKFVQINLPTTVLITDKKGSIKKQTHSYLMIQKSKPDTTRIYQQLIHQCCHYQDIKQYPDFQKLLDVKGMELDYLLNRFKISKKQFLNFAHNAYYVYENNKILVCDQGIFNQIFHNIITHLTEQGIVLQPFKIQYIQNILQIKIPLPILKMALIKFKVQNQQNIFKLSLQSIARYAVSQLGIAKKEYLKSDFDDILNKLLKMYIPIGVEVPKELPVISQFFLHNKQSKLLIYYNIFLLPNNLKDLIQTISKIKLRYSYDEIRGLFRNLQQQKSFQELVIKNFRKYAKDYQLKSSCMFDKEF